MIYVLKQDSYNKYQKVSVRPWIFQQRFLCGLLCLNFFLVDDTAEMLQSIVHLKGNLYRNYGQVKKFFL